MTDPSSAAGDEIGRLEAIAAGDPGAPVFSALAEAQRRDGRPELAERTAREGLRHRPDQVAGRVVLGLALLDQNRVEEARRELVQALEAVPDHLLARAALDRTQAAEPPGLPAAQPEPAADAAPAEPIEAIGQSEIDRAFESAESDPDQMVDADQIVQEAMRSASLDEPEGVAALENAVRDGSPFATRSMAELLERQGHVDDARALRDALGAVAPHERSAMSAADGSGEAAGRRAALIRTLERWLENLRRGAA